jgi:hypothetical protein
MDAPQDAPAEEGEHDEHCLFGEVCGRCGRGEPEGTEEAAPA